MYRVARPHTAVGRLLVEGQAESGTAPFIGQRNNIITLRLTLGFTLRSQAPALGNLSSDQTQLVNETDVSAADIPLPQVEIQLPMGYTCSVVGNGMADPDGTKELFLQDANNDGFKDYYRGTLVMGTWSSVSNNCTFTMSNNAAIFAGQVWFTLLSVDNPRNSLLRDDPSNVWTLRVQSPESGSLGIPYPFISLLEESSTPGWVGNLAVISPLQGENIQPTEFNMGIVQNLYVFFRSVHSLPAASIVVLDAPAGFDFGSPCHISDLDDQYYSDWLALAWGQDLVGARSVTRTFGGIIACIGDQWGRHALASLPTGNFTRARIRVAHPLDAGATYGFQIRTRNAPSYRPAAHTSWKLWVQSPEGYPVDGSKQTVVLNPARIGRDPVLPYDNSWATYASPLSPLVSIDFNASSVLPTSVALIEHKVTIYPITVNIDGFLTSIRIIAPNGYSWKIQGANGFLGFLAGKTCETCKLLATPIIRFNNELTLTNIVLRAGQQYGFQARIEIPDYPPTKSSNFFSMEIGYQNAVGERRISAGIVAAPTLRVIRDAQVHSLSNAANYLRNTIEFKFCTASLLETGQGFALQ